MFFRKPSSPKSESRPAASPPYERRREGQRCVVESLAQMSLSGWAATASLQPVSIELCCGAQVVPATVQRLARADVLEHLGAAAASAELGFAIDLPTTLWQHAAADGSVAFHLRLDGDDRDMPTMRVGPEDLGGWLDQVLAVGDTPERTRAWARAAPHLQQALPPAGWQRAEQRWQAADAEHRARDRLPGTRLQWAIEQRDELRIVGWAADPNGGEDSLTLLCNGQPLAAPVVRFERADVREALGDVRLDSGFELALPPTLWTLVADGQTAELQLSVNGRSLLAPPLALSRAMLIAAVANERAAAAALSPPLEPAEQHYRALLQLEHVIAAGVGRQLPPEDAARLGELAARHGLEAAWPAPQADAGAADPLPGLNQAIWQLQRRFNATLGGPAAGADGVLGAERLAGALDDCLRAPADGPHDAPARRRFLVSMVPFFCAAETLPMLRPRLDADELHTLTLAHGRWELSLLLPVTVLDELAGDIGRLQHSAALMERLAAAPEGGWLNSAAVLDALRRLALALRSAPVDDTELDRFIAASLQLFGRLGDEHGSRLYDDHLIEAACQLLSLARHAGEAAVQQSAEAALRHYGLTPVFWAALSRTLPGPATWPPVLQTGHRHFERLRDAWPRLTQGDTDAGPACGAALRQLRELGCADVDSLQRQALLIATQALPSGGSRDAARGLRGLPPADALRWLGRLPHALPALAPTHNADTLLRLASPVPTLANLAARRTAQRAMAALRHLLTESHSGAATDAVNAAPHTDASAAGTRALPATTTATADALLAAQRACLAVAGERDGFAGLGMLAAGSSLLRLAPRERETTRPPAPDPASDWTAALRTALDHALAASERGRERHPVPAAAIVAALAWLRSLALPGNHAAAADLTAFVADCDERLRAQWHGDADAARLPLPLETLLPVETPGVGTLVVVRSPEPGPASGAEPLLARLLWQQQPGAARLLERASPASPPRVQAESLCSLLAWLLAHSDFGHLLLLDADAELDLDAWLTTSAATAHHYHGLASPPLHAAPGAPLDKSPPGTRFARIANGLSLSRYAAQRALALQHSARGARLARGSSCEEKYLGDLMALAGIQLADEGHSVHQRRAPRPGATPFTPAAFHNLYAPGGGWPTVLTHADADAAPRPAAGTGAFLPRRLWPSDCLPRLANDGSGLQLVELSEPSKAAALSDAECIVVAVARNERLLMPHFLAHYRQLGARHFVIVDNLSDDGTREYLLAQDDVVVYSADTPYRQARYGVTWQQTVLAAHGHGRWALLADIDEFLVWPGNEQETLPQLCRRLDAQGAEAACVLMIDMYPPGSLEDADLAMAAPFDAAPCFDSEAVLPWRLGSGSYSNGPTWLSGLRHRLMPDSAPNHYTSQKIALMRHQPWVRFSEGLHYAAGLQVASQKLAFAHFKYHRGFRAKVLAEVARKQHYNGAEEYRQYRELLSEARTHFFEPGLSRHYENSQSFAAVLR